MANSVSHLDTISASQASKEVTANAMFDAESHASLYGRRASTTTGLTWGFYGGYLNISGTLTSISNGTVALTASQTNYVEANPATGAVSKNTSAFTAGYIPLYTVVTGAATVTGYTDHRALLLSGQRGQAYGVASLDASGLIPIAQIPPTSLERLVAVADQTARYALTTATVQNGDTVKQNDTGLLYLVKDDTNLGNANGYEVYVAGTAAAVPLSGVTGLGTGVATALAVNVGTAGAPVVQDGALGTPSSGGLGNCTGLPAGGLSATATDVLFGRSTAGAGAGEEITCTAAARTVLDDAAVADMVNTLGGATSTGAGGLVRNDSPTLTGRVTSDSVILAAVNKTYHTPVSTTIVANIVYDTREDSDGGAWRKRCQHTSWYKETIYGKWLGENANETAARAVTGAGTNDYYHNLTDGKFYALNAGSGQTEVFRGNRREFPEQAIIIAEVQGTLSKVIIYDATDSSISMWAVISRKLPKYSGTTLAPSIAAANGTILFGAVDGYGGLFQVNFPAARITWRGVGQGASGNGIFIRESFLVTDAAPFQLAVPSSFTMYTAGAGLVNNTVNSVAITTLPDAPIDSATGLPVPTIAVATAGGVSVIKDDGVVRNSALTTAAYGLSYDELNRVRWNTTTEYNCSPVPPLSASFTASSATEPKLSSAAYSSSNLPLGIVIASATGKSTRNAIASTNGLSLYRAGQSSAALFADVTKDYNSGWMVGDIRRAFLANSKTVDRSVKAGTLTEVGTVTETVNSGGRNVYSGFSSSNYFQEASHADWNALGTGDFGIRMAAVKWGTSATLKTLFSIGDGASNGSVKLEHLAANTLRVSIYNTGWTTICTSTATFTDTAEHTIAIKRYTQSGVADTVAILVDGVVVASAVSTLTISNATGYFRIGEGQDASQPWAGGQCSCVRISATAGTAEQSKFIADTENKLNGGVTCLLAGTSNAVSGIPAFDKKNELLHVPTSYGRSTFNNLQRVEAEATAVGAPVSYGAYDGTLLQAGTSAKVAMPAKYLRDEIYRASEDAARRADTTTAYSFTSSGTTQNLPQGMKATGGVMFNSTDSTHSVPVQTFDGFVYTLTGLTNAKVYNLNIRRA